MSNNSTQSQIDKMIIQLGLHSEYQLCDYFEIDQSAVSKWKTRGSVPSEYVKKAENIFSRKAECAQIIDEVRISAAEIADILGVTLNSFYQIRKKKAYLCEIVEAGLKLKKSL
jgi:predicted transcriptional regulator